MGYALKQGQTSRPLLFKLYQTGTLTAATGITPTVTLSKNGGAFASPAGAVTEVANGWYAVAGNATDANTLGPLVLHATGTGCDDTDEAFEVVAFDPADAAALGLSNLDAAVTTRATAAGVLAAGDVDGYTLEETLKLCLAALAGKLSGAATTTVAIRAADDSKARITATVDSSGNRTAITLDETG